MDKRTAEPDRDLKRTGDELEGQLERLDDHIDDSRRELKARSEEADDPAQDVAGDWDDTEDDAGGQDASAFDDPEAEEEDEDV
jgi:hypothetical protein